MINGSAIKDKPVNRIPGNTVRVIDEAVKKAKNDK